jgi:hypothetical protein
MRKISSSGQKSPPDEVRHRNQVRTVSLQKVNGGFERKITWPRPLAEKIKFH